jgi:hypothetical protein
MLPTRLRTVAIKQRVYLCSHFDIGTWTKSREDAALWHQLTAVATTTIRPERFCYYWGTHTQYADPISDVARMVCLCYCRVPGETHTLPPKAAIVVVRGVCGWGYALSSHTGACLAEIAASLLGGIGVVWMDASLPCAETATAVRSWTLCCSGSIFTSTRSVCINQCLSLLS